MRETFFGWKGKNRTALYLSDEKRKESVCQARDTQKENPGERDERGMRRRWWLKEKKKKWEGKLKIKLHIEVILSQTVLNKDNTRHETGEITSPDSLKHRRGDDDDDFANWYIFRFLPHSLTRLTYCCSCCLPGHLYSVHQEPSSWPCSLVCMKSVACLLYYVVSVWEMS